MTQTKARLNTDIRKKIGGLIQSHFENEQTTELEERMNSTLGPTEIAGVILYPTIGLTPKEKILALLIPLKPRRIPPPYQRSDTKSGSFFFFL